jgi:hypothetical protein
MVSGNKPALLQCIDVLGNRRLGTDSKVTRDLRIRWLVTVLGEELSDVVENFFLTLSAWQH